MLKESEPSSCWHRESTGDALVELLVSSLSADSQELSQYTEARQALVDIAGALAAMNNPITLAIQERIKQLR